MSRAGLCSEEEKTQEAYDLLVQKSEKLKLDADRINGMQAEAQERLKTVFSDLSYNETTKLFDSSFKNLDAYKEWRDKHIREDAYKIKTRAGELSLASTFDNIGTFVQESIRTAKDATLGLALAGYNTLTVKGGFDKDAHKKQGG